MQTDLLQNTEKTILKSTLAVVQLAQNVRINQERLGEFVKRLAKELPAPQSWDKERHFFDDTAKTVQWLFVLDSLNFSFWPDLQQERWIVPWNGQMQKGYWALACSLTKAMQSRPSLTDASFLEHVDEVQLAEILDGNGSVPMLKQRVQVLNEIGGILLRQYDGLFVNLIAEAQYSAQRLVRLITTTFPCFNDVTSYCDKEVYFFKRAQILVNDLSAAFNGTRFGRFDDLERLTAFADYKLPQLLRALGIIEYSPDLANKVDNQELLPAGSPDEVEIRAATIYSVNELAKQSLASGFDVKPCQIDWWLWELSHETDYEKLPHHRTRTIFY